MLEQSESGGNSVYIAGIRLKTLPEDHFINIENVKELPYMMVVMMFLWLMLRWKNGPYSTLETWVLKWKNVPQVNILQSR